MSNVEVFILNYNGNSFLPDCLNSLKNLNLGNNHISINVIDNNSPISPNEILSRFPEVNYIPLGFNGGFSTGNNLGVWNRLKQIKTNHLQLPDYLVFLNNDTIVDAEWLNEAVNTLEKNPTIGVLGSKAFFMDKFAKITFNTEYPFKLEILSSSNIHEIKRFKFRGNPRNGNIYTIYNSNELFIPVEDEHKKSVLFGKIINENESDIIIKYSINNGEINSFKVNGRSNIKLELNLNVNDYRRLIQNAGSYLTKDWWGGDLGFLEFDNGQFNNTEERQAICGVSMFVRTDLFRKLNGFDQKYFAYFEDTDLSLRARLAGYYCVFEPKSKLLHLHCGSSTEYSDYFNLNVTWSYFLFVSRYAGHKEWLRVLLRYLKKAYSEFNLFCNDKSFEHKYYLRSVARAIKSPFYFIKNRFLNLFGTHAKLN